MNNIFPCYDKQIYRDLINGKALKILKKHIYAYRENTDNPSYHFLIGLCMLHMGYYREAKIAFERVKSSKGKIFSAYASFLAQRDEEAREILLTLPINELPTSEILAMMSLKSSLHMNMTLEREKILHSDYQTEADRLIFHIFAEKYIGNDISSYVNSLSQEQFSDVDTYLFVIEELYKLKIDIDHLIDNVKTTNATEFSLLLKTMYATGYYSRIQNREKYIFFAENEIKLKSSPRNKWKKNLSDLYCMEYDLAEAHENTYAMDAIAKKLETFSADEKNTLYLVTYDMSHFEKADKAKLKQRLERLIKMNQHNIRYRKLYCDFLRSMGLLKLSDDVAKATLLMRQDEEQEEFNIIKVFHSFYCTDACMLLKDHKENCPICFGTGYQPIIRSIGFGHSPADIFTENMEKSVLQMNESMLKALVDFQPMNIPSPIVNKYLHSLGAYMSIKPYPDVLVPGETYIFIQMKTETYKRLASEGYSLMQIDPLLSAMNAAHPRKEMSIFNEEGKEITDIPVSADDFVVEIIHAISKSED